MYIKKYLQLLGEKTGTVKYEADNKGTNIHIRITSEVENVLRAYLTKIGGAHEYAGVLSENGELIYETKLVFDGICITEKNNGQERICASAFLNDAYEQNYVVNQFAKRTQESRDELLSDNEEADISAQKAAKSYSDSSSITFHIASEENGDAAVNTSKKPLPSSEAKDNDEDADFIKALGALALLILYLGEQEDVSCQDLTPNI
ncbi:MAG: hypothetical protein IJG50_07945 [Clostridia bacterium]|nr:hypothetical protein [Clostridia bacterium]